MGTAGRNWVPFCRVQFPNLFALILLLVGSLSFAGCALSPTGYTGDPGKTKSPTLRSINLKPSSSSTGVGEELQFTATGKYSDGSTKDLTGTVTWASSNANEVTIETSGQSNPGLAMGMAPGTVNVTASTSGLTATGKLTVNTVGPSPTQAALTSMSLTPGSVTLGMPSIQQFIATGTYGDGSVGDITDNAMWTSSNPAVVFIQSGSQDNPGFAVAMSPGTATITASMSGLTQSVTFTVNPFKNPLPQIGGITAVPPTQTLGNNQVSNTDFETGATNWNLPSC